MSTPRTFTPDPHSFARPVEARTTHVTLDLEVDFAARKLRGTASLDLEVADGAASVVLDTRRLAIRAVTDGAGRKLDFALAKDDPVLGAALTVTLPEGVQRVVVDYETARDADALQWLAPEQTAGGTSPFLFTQGHAIQTRSWIPLQDSPSVRVTYEARITAPRPLVALMSAEQLAGADDGEGVFRFRMPEPIPPYLIALAVGDLGRHEVGPRTAVFAEPVLLARAAHELAEMESMLEAAEALIGPYLWGRFDVLFMPPAFPYGGMENPRLTFASPTLIVGDRSLTTVIVHELAHAWAGNLVTNATWNDFWINEGTTVYLELRLNEALWGAERAEMLKCSGFRDLTIEIERMGATSPDTRLHYDMTGRDPAEGVTVIPYLKGAAFFWSLERHCGRERLDPWLRSWFSRHAFGSVTTEMLLADLREHLFGAAAAAEMSGETPLDLERWVEEPGVPDNGAPPPSALLARVDDAAARIVGGAPASSIDPASWTPQAWRHFLGTVLAAAPSPAVIAELDAAFSLSRSDNPEVLLPWLRLEVHCENDAATWRIAGFVAGNGRMKYLRPIYADLLGTAWGKPIARQAYAAARPRYHAIVQGALDRLFAANP